MKLWQKFLLALGSIPAALGAVDYDLQLTQSGLNLAADGLEVVSFARIIAVEPPWGHKYFFNAYTKLEQTQDGNKIVQTYKSNDFSPIISAQYIGKDIIEIDYQSKKLYMSYSNEGCIDNNCDINISPVNAILPFYNISLNRYYLQVLQKVYGGYSANNFGYVVSMLQINEDGYDVINIGVLSNFEYIF